MSSVVNFNEYENIPARTLNMSIRNLLAQKLDRDQVSSTPTHLLKNWMGLAELLGYNYDEIENFDVAGNGGKTKMLLRDYTMKGGDVATLLQSLQDLERYDILEDAVFQQTLRKDVESFVSRQQQEPTQRPLEQMSVQVPEVSSGGQPGDIDEDEEDLALTTLDCQTGTANMYDAYVIYADEDFPFVREMMTQLEDNFGVRLCIANRDMLAGAAQFQATAAMIRRRCSKVIVVMSPAFKRSSMCTFATNFAFSLCPSTLKGILVPILYTPCQIPDMLRYIAPLDFTKVEYIQWFWERLQHSLKPVHITSVRGTQQEQPPPYEELTIDDVNAIPCQISSALPDPGISSRVLVDAVSETDGAVGGVPVPPVGRELPIKMDPSKDVVSLPPNSGRRKKPWYQLKSSKGKPKSQTRHTHTTSDVSTSEPEPAP